MRLRLVLPVLPVRGRMGRIRLMMARPVWARLLWAQRVWARPV